MVMYRSPRFDDSDRYISHGVLMSIKGISEKRTGTLRYVTT